MIEFSPVIKAACIGFPVALLLGAILLRIATRIVTAGHISFRRALLTALMVLLATLVVALVVGFAGRLAGVSRTVAEVVAGIVGFFPATAIYGRMIQDPATGQPIGFGKGGVIFLIVLVFSTALAAIIGLIIAGIGRAIM